MPETDPPTEPPKTTTRRTKEPDSPPFKVDRNPGGHVSLPAALVAFQAEIPVVVKGSTAQIPGKDGRAGYSYRYADLPDVTAAAYPALSKNGLSFIALPRRTENGSYELVGRLTHCLGESIEAALPIDGRQAQQIGSSLTYGRRYLLGCMTGIVTDDDDDGAYAHAAEERTAAVPPGPEPYQQELFTELSALSPEVVTLVQSRWPFASTDVYTFTRGECQQVRAIVDLAIAEAAKATEQTAEAPAAGETP